VSLRFSTPVSSPLYPSPPYHYDGAELFLALFYGTEESVQALLPEPLRPTDMNLMALLFGRQPCRETGPFMEAGLLVQCLFENPETGEEEVGVFFSHNFVTTDVAMAAGREIWGYPRKLAKISMDWDGDVLRAYVERHDTVVLQARCEMTEEGEWIDSGPNVNLHLIPRPDGSGHALAEITAAYLDYDIKSGRSGDVEIEINSGPDDDFSAVAVEGTMIGLYFKTDIILPPARVIHRYE